MKKSIQDKEAYITASVNVQISIYNNNWFRFFIKYDPATALENLQIPVLMTFGGLDLQVSASHNKPKMEEALTRGGNKNFKSILFSNANHLYQEAQTGSPSEYANLPKEFVSGFLDEITKWIKDNTN